MKTIQRQGFRRRGRGASGLQVVMLMLVMLTAGISPAWAGGSWDKTNTDKGGGTYRFKGEWDTHDPSNDAYFETAKHFDLDKDQFYWDFAMRVDFRYLQSGRLETVAIDGYIYLVTSDNVSHQIAYWKKEHPTGIVYLSKTDDRWGTINNAGYIWGEEYASFFYTPNSQAVQDGVKRIIFTHYCYESWDPGLSFWVQYEKDITFSGLTEDKPMPKPTIEWGDDGRLSFKATGVADKRNNSNYDRQGYIVTLNYYDNGIHYNGRDYTTDDNRVSISNETNGKMDMAFSFWPLTTSEAYARAYTVPVYVDYYGFVQLNQSNLVPEGHILSQPRVEGVLVKPFTRPTEVSVEFDKWNKKNTVKWKRQTKVKGYDGSKEVDVECRYKEGKWYVVRYAKGSDATDYKVVGTLNGDAKTLQLSDADIEYDKEYVYRVIFLPTILESKFKDHLATLPGYSNSKNATAYDLWNEASIDTKLSVHITLSQDASYTEAVRLKWQYSIPVSGMTWYVEYKQPGEKTWREKTETIAVDPNQTEASADFGGTVCDPVTYRIKTKVGGTFVYSDTLTTRLASGSYIKNVTATTGTEEKVVKITWDVANPDVVNDISYRVKRRPIGIEEWTTVYETSDKLSHYECEDQRPQTGTYYEYTVEAYGAKCPEQLDVKMDGIVVPGFSQARGTITGHIAFGSGTAVQGVRVSLVKSSADQESDQVQYLSRFIEGAGAGLLWTADSAKYAGVFTGQKPATLQLWAKPSGDGDDQMALATLNGALQLGVKKVGSEGAYKTVTKAMEYEYGPEEVIIRKFTADAGTGGTGIEGYDKLVDDTGTFSKWCTGEKQDGVYYCEFHSSEPVYVKGYRFTTGNDNSIYKGRNPKSWILKAKLNKDGAWETIATVTNDQVMKDKNYEIYTFVTDKEGLYQYFRFEISENQSSDHDVMQLGALHLITKKKVEKLVDKTVDIASVTKRERPAGTADTDYCLYTVDLSGGDYSQYKVTEFPNLTFGEHDFTHISAVYDGAGKWKFYVGTDSLLTDSITVAGANWKAIPAEGTKTLAIGGSNQAVNTTYKGHVDDIRLWARALKTAEVEANYTRILGGAEDGLRLYWPLDEGELVRQYAFDIACQDGIYQLNHPEVGPNAVPRKEVPKHLTLYGVTDSEGDYIIKGIPFQQGGTNYKVTPLLGAHEFSPGTRSMFISPTSLTANNIDFEDVSSFPMQGYVYYVGTNIPVEGAMLYVDGQVQSAFGEFVKTDAKGHYEMSVPIGDHYVEVKLDDHKMVDGGRFPKTEKTHKFTESVRYDFADSTLVNFIGRVAGGERNDTLGVGFGNNERIVGRPSKNNIGVATIALKLNSDKASFNTKTGTTETYQTFRTWESDTVSVNSHSFTGIDSPGSKYSDKLIYIQTDSVTGEFSALLPPLKYTVQSIKIGSNDQIEFTELPEIDLTAVKELRSDSVKMVKEGSADTTWVKYSYVAKMVKTYFAPPQLDVVDTGADPGFFGLKTVTFPSHKEGEPDVVIDDLYKEGRTPRYLVDYPIYQTGQTNVYNLYGYEVYENRDIAGKVETDTIALPHVDVTVANEMSSEQKIVYEVMDESTGYKPGQPYEVTTQQIPLDDEGKGVLKWMTGFPNITEPYTRKFSVAMERKGRTYNVANLDAIVLGQLTDGNNFVTKGPDKVNYVLRDPQGAKSTTKLSTGTITTTTTYDTRTAYGEYKAIAGFGFGVGENVGAGVGLILMSKTDAVWTLEAGVHTTWEKTWNKNSEDVTTKMENVSTSGSTPYVGAPGDIYIGTSLNWLIGTCRHLFIDYNEEKKKYEVKMEPAISIGDTISTAFKFTQYELETVMIPKWKDMRRQFLTEVATEEEARSYVNNGKSSVYLTWKGLNEASYVDGENYIWAPPKGVEHPDDSVLWCNNQILAWEQTIRENEADKVRLMEKGKKRNISIDGGSSYNYTRRTSNTKHDETIINWKIGAVINNKFGLETNKILANVVTIDVETENGGGQTTDGGTITENFTEWEYNIEDGNRDTDLSLTIYESDDPKYSDFFSVFGGQTYNPYQEQEWTHYYKNDAGNYVALGNSTEQMEQPDMRIGLPGENTAKIVTVTDIPAGGEATVMLQCTNLGHSHQGVDFSYDIVVLDETNTNGLQILMDGVPINGRSLYLEHGQTVSKVLTIRQTDQSIMDYEGITLWFASQYQPAKIHDEVVLNAHFVPSSSPIVLAIDEPVVNCKTDSARLEMKVKDFNRQFKNLKNVGVQYRFAGNTQWTNMYTWWVNKEDTVGLDKLSNTLMAKTGDLKLKVKMLSDLTYPEGTYEFRAFSTTPYGSEMVHRYSDVVNVVKDRTRPINLYTPAPANGILGYGDQMAIEFNEDIVPGYVGADNVIVTAKLNSSEVKHEVAYRLLPDAGIMPKTVNPVFMSGSFAMDFWLNWHDPGTVLHLGYGTDNFALSIDKDGYVTVTMAQKDYRSEAKVPKDTWVFFAMNYDTDKMTFNMLALEGTNNIYLFTDQPVSTENVQAVHYLSDNHMYLGPIDADIHSLGLYNYCRSTDMAAKEKYEEKDGYVYGLTNYWPMDEGHGTVAADKRHTHDFEVEDMWTLANTNYGLRISTDVGVMADISQVNTGPGESYAIELWYNKSAKEEGEVVFESATPDQYDPKKYLNKVPNLRLQFDGKQDLVLTYGEKSQVVASHEDFPDLRRYHHYALNVVRGQAASFYLDGKRTAVIPEADVPPIEDSRLIVGRDNEELAYVDEIRIWHATLSESSLLGSMYNTLDTASIYSRGLVAYYPFEKRHEENSNVIKVKTLDNMAPGAAAKAMLSTEEELFKHTPPLKNAPDEQPLTVTPIASERKVVINLTGTDLTPRKLEGTTLNITVDKIHDLHGNESQPIRWTAYVQQNTLMWAKDSVNIFKQYGDDYTFDVDIENKSGSTELYTLYNMPQWLSLVDSERTDDVQPLKTKTLRFEVNPLTPVGNYDATIGLQGNNGIQEPMRIVMKVRGEKPQWAVDPTKYDHNMSIIGQVYIGGILMENPESMVGAFINGECRGVASPEKVRGAAYVTMNVYGNDDKRYDMGKEVTFRIWDASRGVAYTDANIAVSVSSIAGATSADSTVTTVIFGQDKMLGTFDAPAIWTKSENVEQLIPIHENWNWIAFGVEPQSTCLDHVFGAYAEWSMLIKSRSAVNDYNGAEWGFGTLKRAKANEMYKLKIGRLPTTKQEAPNSLLAVSGRQLKENKERAVMLGKGWNWIAYTPLTTMTVDEALAAANPKKGDIVKSQTGVAIYGNYGWEGSLKALESGRGYLYYSNANDSTSFLYPTASASARLSSASARSRSSIALTSSQENTLRIFKPVPLGLYPGNMTMTIQLTAVDGSPIDTCEVAAFIGDECRGATRASDNGLYYLVISGDGAGQAMTLRTCINGDIIDIDKTQQYVSDANIGTSWEPYVIDLGDVLSGIRVVSGFPADDDSDWWTLQGFKIGCKPTQPGIYIHHGEKVVVKREKKK